MNLDREHIERELILSRCVEKLLDKPGYYAFLIGAGVSVCADIPLGGGIVRILRQRLLEELRREVSPDAAEDIFQKLGWFQDRETEYSEAILRAFSSDHDRQAFFRELISGKMPTLAHYYLASIIAHGCCNLVLTTNFDDLLEKAFASLRFDQFNVITHHTTTEYVFSSSGLVTLVKLHGHYTFPQLANLTEETRKLSGRLQSYFESLLRNYGLIVCGYAGRDKSVMAPLEKAVRRRTMPKGMLWCIRKETDIKDSSYLRALSRAGIGNIHFLRIEDADSFYQDLHNRLGLSDIRVLNALSSERYDYQRKKFMDRLATGLSLELPEQVIDNELHYELIQRSDELDMHKDTFVSTRRLAVRNVSSRPIYRIKHLEVGEKKITHSDLSLTGRVLSNNALLSFEPLNDPSLGFCRAFDILLPSPILPGQKTEIEYSLSWPGEPSTYGQQPHSQSISLLRYRKGVSRLVFKVTIGNNASIPITHAWVLGVDDRYKEREVLESCNIEKLHDNWSFQFATDSPKDCLYILYYQLGLSHEYQ